jgi:hypothetical protein
MNFDSRDVNSSPCRPEAGHVFRVRRQSRRVPFVNTTRQLCRRTPKRWLQPDERMKVFWKMQMEGGDVIPD